MFVPGKEYSNAYMTHMNLAATISSHAHVGVRCYHRGNILELTMNVHVRRPYSLASPIDVYQPDCNRVAPKNPTRARPIQRVHKMKNLPFFRSKDASDPLTKKSTSFTS
jgi:hypothetical protein